jgi:CHRD domain
MKLSCAFALLIGLVLLSTSLAGAQSTKFEATLSGKEQSPPIDTPAHGTAVFVLSRSGKSLHYTLSVADIENASMANTHIGRAGEEGPVAVWFYPPKPPAVVKKGKFTGVLARGTITDANLVGPLKGKTIGDLVSDIRADEACVNGPTFRRLRRKSKRRRRPPRTRPKAASRRSRTRRGICTRPRDAQCDAGRNISIRKRPLWRINRMLRTFVRPE